MQESEDRILTTSNHSTATAGGKGYFRQFSILNFQFSILNSGSGYLNHFLPIWLWPKRHPGLSRPEGNTLGSKSRPISRARREPRANLAPSAMDLALGLGGAGAQRHARSQFRRCRQG